MSKSDAYRNPLWDILGFVSLAVFLAGAGWVAYKLAHKSPAGSNGQSTVKASMEKPKPAAPPVRISLSALKMGLDGLSEAKNDSRPASPPNAEALKENGLALFTRFAEAASWQAKKPYVRDADRVESLMKDYYETHHRHDPAMGEFREAFFLETKSGEVLRFIFANHRWGGRVEAILVKQPDGAFLLDWETFAGAGEMDWDDFKRERPTDAKLMRGFVLPDDYYNFEYSNAARFSSYRVMNARGENMVNIFCMRDSPMDRQLKDLVQATEPIGLPMRLKIAFPANAQSDHCAAEPTFAVKGWLDLKRAAGEGGVR